MSEHDPDAADHAEIDELTYESVDPQLLKELEAHARDNPRGKLAEQYEHLSVAELQEVIDRTEDPEQKRILTFVCYVKGCVSDWELRHPEGF
jgi:hypothetical protein